MMSGLGTYPAYRDSGVPWLGEIPAHWETKPLKRWARINSDVLLENTVDHFEFRYLDIGTVGTGTLTGKPQVMTFGSAPSRARRVLRRGDTIISTVRTYLKAVYFIAENECDMIASTGFAVLRPREGVDPRFLSFLVRSDPFTDRVSANSVGTAYPAISETKLGTFHVAIPPPDEQAAIVRYLDYVDRRVRKYIAAKRKLIALLNEEKQAIIHRAVTRGLDPDVRLKPSGVEWLGDVPAHWDIVLNQRIFKEEIRPHSGNQETQLSLSQRDGLIATSAMQERSLQTSTYDNWKVTIPGDLVLNRFKAHLGVFFSSTLRGIVSFHYGVFAPRRSLNTKYFELLYHTNVYRTIYAGRSNGMTVGLQNLSNQNFYGTQSVVPPVQEQDEIVSYAEETAQRLGGATDAIRQEIALLVEYRTRLIADVVTGKVDVRAAARSLPVEGEDAPVVCEELNEDPVGAMEPEPDHADYIDEDSG